MEYTVHKIENQALAFCIKMQHKGKEISFNVVCATDESEIADLVAHHIAFLEAPVSVYQAEEKISNWQTAAIQEQQALITALTARIEALETK